MTESISLDTTTCNHSAETFIITHKIKNADALHRRGDKAEIGILDINTSKYEMLDITGAWNFQQGAMLQWNPSAPDEEIIYNSLGDSEYNATILNIHTEKNDFWTDR